MADQQTTICAIATPPGRGGIGIVRISGPAAPDIAKAITGLAPVPRQAVYCAFRDRDGGTIDSGIMLYFNAPGSYTGEEVIELQGHGGQVVLNMVQRRVIELGAAHARPGEFTERAFLNCKLDLIQAEAVVDLIDSVSEQAARCANRSLQGEFSDRVNDLLEALINLRVYVEGALDFPEEEVDFFADDVVQARTRSCLDSVDRILAGARYGRILNEGIQAAIIGRPNVGKSSLLNRLSRTDRAIVTDVPGTTRDVVQNRVLVKGVAVMLSDTAGIRETGDRIEREGIHRAIAETEKSDIVLLVLEHDNHGDDIKYLRDKLKGAGKAIIVRNKIDLIPVEPRCTVEDGLPHIYLSAKTGAGMDLLEDMILQCVAEDISEENTVLARERHIDALTGVRTHLLAGLAAVEEGQAAELLAAELQQAQQRLASITGEYVADDLLGEIFSRFCIGK